jgi:glycine oxidase
MEHVVIIGAGVMGCACAHRLLEAGFRVTLLERALPGAESSASAAGILGAQSEVAEAGPFFELCLASRSRFRTYAAELEAISRVSIHYEDSGTLEVALDHREGELVAARAAWMLERGLRVEILDRPQVLQLEPELNPRLVGANYYPDDHQVDPVALSRSLAAAVARLGGRFQSGTSVNEVITDGSRIVGVRTPSGVMAADHVVMAAGAWSSSIAGLPVLRTTVRPMAGQIVHLETRPPRLRHIVYGCQGYIVPRADGRILLGSTLENRGFDKAVTLEGVNRIARMGLDMVPTLGNGRWVEAWSGLRPATADGLPLLGRSPVAGLYFATGHFRNGILLTPITAEVITALVQGKPSPVYITPFMP